MNIVELHVPKGNSLSNILSDIRKNGVKHYPVTKVHDGWRLTIDKADNPIVSYLILKYDLNTLN